MRLEDWWAEAASRQRATTSAVIVSVRKLSHSRCSGHTREIIAMEIIHMDYYLCTMIISARGCLECGDLILLSQREEC